MYYMNKTEKVKKTGVKRNNTNNKSAAAAKAEPKKRQSTNRNVSKTTRTASKRSVVRKPKEPSRKTPVKIIPLGGLNEIGKNCTVIECSNDMFVIDCGMAFPDSELLGVDIVLPDYSYVEKNIDKLRGVVLTHGHEDTSVDFRISSKSLMFPFMVQDLHLVLWRASLKNMVSLEDPSSMWSHPDRPLSLAVWLWSLSG